MTEVRTNTKVKDIVMSYQQYLRSVSNPDPIRTSSPASNHSIHRKPPPNWGPSTLPNTPVLAHRSVTQPMTSTPSLTSTTAPPTASTYAPPTPTSITQPVPFHLAPALAPAVETGTLTREQVDSSLSTCLSLLIDATTVHDKQPFSALLLGPDATTVVATQYSLSHYQHAESELARLAASQYAPSFLSKCTLVSAWEPCAMCSGTIYWSGIGRLLYAASEKQLQDLTGKHNPENLMLDLSCRTVFNAGQRPIETIGPIQAWEDKIVLESKKYWDAHPAIPQNDGISGGRSISGGQASNRNSILVLQPEEQVLSSIGEDGEYKADLTVDWF